MLKAAEAATWLAVCVYEHGNEAVGLDEDREVVCTKVPLGTLHVTHRNQKSLIVDAPKKSIPIQSTQSKNNPVPSIDFNSLAGNLTTQNYTQTVAGSLGQSQGWPGLL